MLIIKQNLFKYKLWRGMLNWHAKVILKRALFEINNNDKTKSIINKLIVLYTALNIVGLQCTFTSYKKILQLELKLKRALFWHQGSQLARSQALACNSKILKENFLDKIHIDEWRIKLRLTTHKNWNKELLRSAIYIWSAICSLKLILCS